MLKINWNSVTPSKRTLYFDDLAVNEGFRNASYRGRGAVYLKVVNKDNEYYMLEVETGRLWSPTESPVERVNLELNVPTAKPNIY